MPRWLAGWLNYEKHTRDRKHAWGVGKTLGKGPHMVDSGEIWRGLYTEWHHQIRILERLRLLCKEWICCGLEAGVSVYSNRRLLFQSFRFTWEPVSGWGLWTDRKGMKPKSSAKKIIRIWYRSSDCVLAENLVCPSSEFGWYINICIDFAIWTPIVEKSEIRNARKPTTILSVNSTVNSIYPVQDAQPTMKKKRGVPTANSLLYMPLHQESVLIRLSMTDF